MAWRGVIRGKKIAQDFSPFLSQLPEAEDLRLTCLLLLLPPLFSVSLLRSIAWISDFAFKA